MNKDSKNADSNIKYCTSCKKCWEITLVNNFRKKQRKIFYYEDFPAYGKERETCDKCKRRDEMGQMGWIAHLCATQDRKELEEFLGEKGFKDPKFAANEFLKAEKELREEKTKKDNKMKSSGIKNE